MRYRQQKQESISRRRFLGWGIGAIVAGVAAAIGWPALRYSLTPALAKKESATAASLGPVDSFVADEPQNVVYEASAVDGWYIQTERKAAWVVKKSDAKFDIFDPRCTHLGCAYHWDQEARHFLCPCHDGIFDINGKVLSGPPPRPLDKLSYEIRDGQLFIHG